MEVYLYCYRIVKRENKPSFFVCTWKGVDGDKEAKAINAKTVEKNGKTVKRNMLNVARANVREVTLTRSIFPTDEDDVKFWKSTLVPLYIQKTVEDENGVQVGELDDNGNPVLKPKQITNEEGEKVPSTLADVTWVNMAYKQIPLSKLDTDIVAYDYTSNGNLNRSKTITVIGFLDEDGNWAEGLTPEEMAQRQLDRGLQNGNYIGYTAEDLEEEEVEKKAEKEKKETKKESLSTKIAKQSPVDDDDDE